MTTAAQVQVAPFGRAEAVAFVRGLIDTPFRHHGRLPGKALDCAGVLHALAVRFGVPYQDDRHYPRGPFPERLLRCLAVSGVLLASVDDARDGSVLVFGAKNADEPPHAGVKTP